MKKQFTVNIPDELWVDSFTQGKTMTLEYDGPDEFTVLQDKNFGFVRLHLDQDAPYDPNIFTLQTYKANDHIEAAYLLNIKPEGPIERKHVTVHNVDGSTHDELDISEATITDYYALGSYDSKENKFNLNLLTRPKNNFLYIKAEENKQYVTAHANAFTTDALKNTANTYINILNSYQTSGNGSIYSWRMSSGNIAEVPVVPPNLIDAVLAYLNPPSSNT